MKTINEMTKGTKIKMYSGYGGNDVIIGVITSEILKDKYGSHKEVINLETGHIEPIQLHGKFEVIS